MLKSPLPRPIPHCLCLLYLNQRAVFEIRPQEGLLSEVAGVFGSASDDPPAKQWQGIITSCEKLSVSKDETVYRFVLEPRFAAMKHFQTSRLFQHQTVPDIVAAVFKHHGFSGVDYRFQKAAVTAYASMSPSISKATSTLSTVCVKKKAFGMPSNNMNNMAT